MRFGIPATPRGVAAATFLAFALLFLIVNRGAYEGFFHGDELDNIQWTRYLNLADWARGFLLPKYYPQNFRPAGHLYFNLMGRTAGLDYRWYVLSVHVLHLLNVWLSWRLLRRRFGFSPWAAGAGALFFGFHMALFDTLWKPMYVFDVLAATFSLLCLSAYSSGGPAALPLAFLCFWLATKSKEMTVMLPAALAAWEYWFGKRRWLRLAPFVALSLVLGVQALVVNATRESEYTLRFGPAAVLQCAAFYASRVLLIPHAGWLLLALPVLLRDRRSYFGLAFCLVLLFPMLLLPGRLFSAYLYVPMVGLGMVAAAAATRVKPTWVVAFFLVWLPYNHGVLRAERRETLSLADENRRYVSKLEQILASNPLAQAYIYDGVPAALHPWGIEAAVKYFTRRGDLAFYPAESSDLEKSLREGEGAVLLSWDPVLRELSAFARAPGEPDASYIVMSRRAPVWQLGEGWYSLTGHFRWCRPRATARLRRPAGATEFELVVNMGPPPAGEPIRAIVYLNGRVAGSSELRRGSGWHTVRWPLPTDAPGRVRVEFHVEPPFVADPERPLGLAVGAFGFLPREQP
ncbi:MAG: hypothetical protein RMI94_02640 [Bryobacterales bacterium]|nr:glycosyltransferase family 39 protein [Bryobacteraceae bacterium]MDW8129418.1 hypothetical protein [Bryobacterales bacterium]